MESCATTTRSLSRSWKNWNVRAKKIPEDVAVTGYDNSLYARQGQGITTITHPQEKLGEMAAKLLLEKLSGVPDEESKVERLIRPELIVRGSSVKTGI